MAIKGLVQTEFGEDKELYIRINNIEANNHGVGNTFRVRGFISKEAFLAKKHYVWERVFDFNPDVSLSLWDQAYAELKSSQEITDIVDC